MRHCFKLVRTLAGILTAAMTAGLAPPLAAQGPESLAPCHERRADVEAYATAFLDDGWSRPAPEVAAEAEARIAEVVWAFATFASPFESAEERDAFRADARAALSERAPGAVILVQGDADLRIHLDEEGTVLSCILGAPLIPAVEVAFFSDEPRPDDAAILVDIRNIDPRVTPPGIAAMRTDAIRIRYDFEPEDSPARSRDAISTSIRFTDDAD